MMKYAVLAVALLTGFIGFAFAQSMPAVNTTPANCSGGNPLAYSSGSWSCSAPIRPTSVIGSLPTCNAAARGTMYIVTDALLPAALATVAATGAVVVPVVCNGSAWIVG